MARRFIDTELFEDEWLMSLPKDSKLLYIYLFTRCNHAGLIELNYKLCSFLTGIKDVEKELANLEGKVVRVNNKNLYLLTNFFKNQYPNYPNDFRASKSAVGILLKHNLWDFKNGKVKSNPELHEEPDERPPEVEPEDPPEDEPEKINHVLEAVDTWNFFAEAYGLSKIIKLTEARKKHIENRLADKDFNLKAILRKVEKSDFLLGKETDWKISFDFIFASKNNYVKILEGNYDGANREASRINELRELLQDIDNDTTLESKS